MQKRTVQALIARATRKFAARNIPEPYLDAEVILGHVVRRDRAWLIAHSEKRISPRDAARFTLLCARRLRHEPVAYLTGAQEFFGQTFRVTKSVLIPRPKTELLVELALSRIPVRAHWRIADIGTGSGNIAVTLACARASIRIDATDISAKALRVARHNADIHGVRRHIRFIHGNLLEPVANASYDVILANVPYVPSIRAVRTSPERSTTFEPARALSGTRTNRSGTSIIRDFLNELSKMKYTPRFVIMEMEESQYNAIRLFAQKIAPAYQWTIQPPAHHGAHILIGER